MFNVTVTFDSGNAISTGFASMGEALEIAKEFYDMLGCREVIIKDGQSGVAWKYSGYLSEEVFLTQIGEE